MAKWREEKKRYRQYQARKKQLPASHHDAIDAVERYALRSGAGTGADVVPTLEALLEIFEQSVADGTSVAEVTGGDPVAFTDAFLRNHTAGPWMTREQQRLAHTIARVSVGDSSRAVEAR